MSEWYDSQQKPRSNIHKLLQKRIKKANPRRTLTAEETKRLAKLETIAEKLNNDKKTLFITEEIFNFPIFGSNTLADYLVMKNARDNATSSEDLIKFINKRYTKSFVENSSTKRFSNNAKIFNSKK